MTLLFYAADGHTYVHITALLQHSAYLHLQNCMNLYNGIFSNNILSDMSRLQGR